MVDKAILALENEADQLRADGKNEEAVQKLQEVLEKDPNYVRAYLGLSVLYHKIGHHEQSVAAAEKAVQLEPDDAFNYTALSVTYQRAFEGTRDPAYIQKAEEAKARASMMR